MDRYRMSARSALRLIGCLDDHRGDFHVGGGWGIDALLGEQTRPHSDLDPWLPDDPLHYGPVSGGSSFPAEALTGTGIIDGVTVPCEDPVWALRWHTGYPPRDVDRHDVSLLTARFNLALPDAFT